MGGESSKLWIWWLSQQDCEAIGDVLADSVPEYIRSEYRSRYGRAGHGRLWSAAKFGAIRSVEWNTSALARQLENCGGIVIMQRDAEHLADLPGILTDYGLRRVAP